ncbi:MAG: tRNA epoxyqueuosine(34) reductase QueG [Planctomycetaceae bacterium]|nr:tRNA epoxyqueuosine(34) reductase QueG [Planctomycetaceae bacterium]
MSDLSDNELASRLKSNGRALGFFLVGIAPASRPDTLDALKAWVENGYHATMDYIPRRLDAYADPNKVLDGVRTVIMAALPYAPPESTPPSKNGRVAAYALGSLDYHNVLRKRLKQLATELHTHRPDVRTRVTVDTAPVLERDFARRAGLGWFGKNTMLINKSIGSYFFLGAILTDCALPSDPVHEASHCGTCTRCLEACPTDAFEGPYVLNAEQCISYLTIERRDEPIPEPLRSQMGDWMFGCDICQVVCPWNRKAPRESIPEFAPTLSANAIRFLTISEAEFDETFGETPLSRPGWEGMARNAAIVLGNLGSDSEREGLTRARNHPSPMVREVVEWARQAIKARHDAS